MGKVTRLKVKKAPASSSPATSPSASVHVVVYNNARDHHFIIDQHLRKAVDFLHTGKQASIFLVSERNDGTRGPSELTNTCLNK